MGYSSGFICAFPFFQKKTRAALPRASRASAFAEVKSIPCDEQILIDGFRELKDEESKGLPIRSIGVFFGCCFGNKVYLVVFSSTRAIYFPKQDTYDPKRDQPVLFIGCRNGAACLIEHCPTAGLEEALREAGGFKIKGSVWQTLGETRAKLQLTSATAEHPIFAKDAASIKSSLFGLDWCVTCRCYTGLAACCGISRANFAGVRPQRKPGDFPPLPQPSTFVFFQPVAFSKERFCPWNIRPGAG